MVASKVSRAADAMGRFRQTFERDVLLAKHAWMFQHTIDESIAPTSAIELLEAAEKAGTHP